MKIRSSFVSNSSSCSFYVKRTDITKDQLDLFRKAFYEKSNTQIAITGNIVEKGPFDSSKDLSHSIILYYCDAWTFCESKEKITGTKTGDDDVMLEFLNKKLKIAKKKLHWHEGCL